MIIFKKGQARAALNLTCPQTFEEELTIHINGLCEQGLRQLPPPALSEIQIEYKKYW